MDPLDEKSWMLGNLDGEMVGGPLSLNQVRAGLKDRSIQGTELLARVGSSAWRPIHEVLADPRSSMPSSMPPPRPERAKPAEWYVQIPGGPPEGPLATELVILGIVERRIPPNARVCLVGASAWSDVAQVKEFANAVRPLLPVPPGASTALHLVPSAERDKLTLIVLIAVGGLVVLGIVLVVVLA